VVFADADELNEGAIHGKESTRGVKAIGVGPISNLIIY
jgi:hypothetical protein